MKFYVLDPIYNYRFSLIMPEIQDESLKALNIIPQIGVRRCVRLGGTDFLKFYEIEDDCLIRVYTSNNDCLSKYIAKFSRENIYLFISKALCLVSCQYVADCFINYNLDLNWFNVKLSESGMCKSFHRGIWFSGKRSTGRFLMLSAYACILNNAGLL